MLAFEAVLALAIWALQLHPAKDESEVIFRAKVAAAAVSVTADPHEQRLLMSIARWESGFNPGVADCTVRGDGGRALSLWQVHARSPVEAKRLCASLEDAASIALERVRESRHACAHLPRAEQLAVYASGSCSNRGGRAASRHRWVE